MRSICVCTYLPASPSRRVARARVSLENKHTQESSIAYLCEAWNNVDTAIELCVRLYLYVCMYMYRHMLLHINYIIPSLCTATLRAKLIPSSGNIYFICIKFDMMQFFDETISSTKRRINVYERRVFNEWIWVLT